MEAKSFSMSLQVAKWGNSLALRIPADYVRSLGIKEGDRVEARFSADGATSIRSSSWNRRSFAQELDEARNSMVMGNSVMDEVRLGGRY